ncbi:MAG: hypothetical protein NXI24_15205 [bacterium]|nr:hypothetical protein [bacterium]
MKQSKQHSKANSGDNQETGAIPKGFSRSASGFREIGGQVTGFYRYLPGNRAEIMAHFQHREQIARLCQRLQLRLEAEYDLAALKNSERRKRARRIGGETPAPAAIAGHDAGQLDLLAGYDSRELPAAFSGDPENAGATDTAAAISSRRSDGQQPAAESADAAAASSARKAGPDASKQPATKRSQPDAAPRTAPDDTSVKNSPARSRTKPQAPATPRARTRTLEDSLSEIRPLGPASLKAGDGENEKRSTSKKRGASA